MESVSFGKATSAPASDTLIFANGTLSSYDLYNNLKSGIALPLLDTSETSIAPLAPAAAGSPLGATIKAFALNSAGDTFATIKPGETLIAGGSVGVDTVYVGDGSTVDATLLGASQDYVYMRGNWSDYTKSIGGTVITFTRSVTVDGYATPQTETVKVVASSSVSLNDHLVFADGAVLSNDAKTALLTNPAVSISGIANYDANTTTPGVMPMLKASVLNGVTNLDPSSNLVLNYSQAVTAQANKYIHIINDANTGSAGGFHGESTANNIDILVTDTSQVTISGGKVTINPGVDLDQIGRAHV